MGTNFSEICIEIFIIFVQENASEIVVCQNGGHFIQEEIS